MIGSKVITPATATLPVTASVEWPGVIFGQYEIHVRLEPAPEETNLANNVMHGGVMVPGRANYFPVIERLVLPWNAAAPSASKAMRVDMRIR